jgi:hypothetical protein
MASWTNSDGLKIDLGITEATSQNPSYTQGGEYKSLGPTRYSEQTIDLTKMNSFGTVTILNDKSFFGAGWVPEMVEVETLVAATGATATLSVGLVKNSDRTTAISATAFVNAVTVASIAAVGTRLTITAGSTGAGANIGVATTFDALWTVTVGTANFTAGKVKVRVYWRPSVAI